MDAEEERPYVPPPSVGTLAFWQGAEAGQLLLAWCRACQRPFYYPRLYCPYCDSEALEWRQASGRAEVYSFTVVHMRFDALPKSWPIPYVLALLRLEEGPMMMSNVVNCSVEDIHVGMQVTVVFKDDALPVFEPLSP